MLELIDELSPEQQQVLTLKFVFNFANAEVATILDKTEGAIKSLQHRALASLQKQIRREHVSTWPLEVGIVGPAELRQDDAVHRAHRARGASTARSAWRRSRRSALAAARRGRQRAQGDAGGDPRRDVPGTGPALLGNLRQVDALLVVLDGFSGDARSRPTTSRRSSSSCSSPTATTSSGGSSASTKQAKSGDAKLRAEVERAREAARARRRGRRRSPTTTGELPAGARAADDEAADRDRERAGRDRPASSRRSSPSCPTRRRPSSATAAQSALDEVVRPARGRRST